MTTRRLHRATWRRPTGRPPSNKTTEWGEGPTPLTRPRIVTGTDGLPHCANCMSAETGVCAYHGKSVDIALGQLKTSSRLNNTSPTMALSKKVVMRGETEE